MTPLIVCLLMLGTAIAIGRWRRFDAIQWIWLLAGSAIAFVIVWFLLYIFIVAPEIQRTTPVPLP